MINGTVTVDLEAIIPVIVSGAGGQQQPIDPLLDTGYSGYLTLPPGLTASLGLVWLGREQGVLADGSVGLFDVYRATVLWDGQPRPVEVDAIDGRPLLGTALLQGHEVRIAVVAGGAVAITALP
jgi:clan AA aspartic protease